MDAWTARRFPAASAAPPLASSSQPVPAGGTAENPFGQPPRQRATAQGLRKRFGSALAAIAAVIAKFFAVIKGAVVLLPNIKLLTTAGTAIVAVVVYSLFFGWTFAIGFVLLLFVYEMGHFFELRREGIKASAPMFIPAPRRRRDDARDARRRAGRGPRRAGGPVLGTLGSAVCLAIGEATNSDLLRALAYAASS